MAHYATPFVGRRAELALATRALDDLDRGSPAALVLSGEPGIGKSRLLAELVANAAERGHLVLSGRAAEFERELPFGLFVEALDDYLASLGEERVGQLAGERAPALAGVFPSLGSLADGSPESAIERFRAHRAVRALLERLAERAPVVLVLDDAHWADAASVELLGHLLRRRLAGGVLLAVAHRTRQAPATLAASLEAASREGITQPIELPPLTEADAEALMGDGLDREGRLRLHRESGGNPFYLEQLLRSGRLPNDVGAAGDGVPGPVVTAIDQELRELPDEARRLLGAAAVAGDPVDADLAEAAACLERAGALHALDELLAADLLRLTEFPRRFRFRHPIVRAAVYESLGPGSRIELHSRAAAELARAGAPATARAHHVERSARRGDEAAIALLAEAAAATAAHAPAASARWLGAALDLMPADSDRRLALLIPRAVALGSSGRMEESRAALLEAIDLLPPEDTRSRQMLTTFCAAVEYSLGRHDEGRARLLEARESVASDSPRARAELELGLAAGHLYAGEFEELLMWAERAHAGAGEAGQARLAAAATSMLALALAQAPRPAQADAAIDAAAARVDALDDGRLAGRLEAAANLGYAEHFRERFDDAIRHLERGIALSRATGQALVLVPMLLGHAFALASRGRLAEARDVVDGAIEGARLAANSQSLAWGLLIQSWVATQAGDLETALRAGREGFELARATEARVLSAAAGWAYGSALAEAGEAEQAIEAIEAMVDGPDLEPVEPGVRCLCFEVLARSQLALGHPGAAADAVARAERAAEAVDLDGARSAALRARADLLLARGDAEAAATARRATEMADRVGAAVAAGRGRVLAGRALAAAGDRDAAIGELERAEAALAACGAERLRREAVRELRRLGRRVAHRSSGAGANGDGLAALSERQRELAVLVAAGKTNREIASELFLSEKTVEGHLGQIFRKLDVRSRSAVAAAVAHEGAVQGFPS